MKNKIITTLLLASAFVYTFAQDNKPGQGDIGFHYGVNFNGGIQQYVGVSGILNKHWELGGTLSFSYTHRDSSFSDPETVEGTSGALNATDTHGERGSNYAFGLSPYLLYHFPINSNLDVYAGPTILVGFGNGNSHTYEKVTATNYEEETDELFSQPATVTIGVGGVLGCQYFFYKNLALGVQAGLMVSYSFNHGNLVDIYTVTGSGSDNPNVGSVSTNSSTFTQNNHNFNLSTMASGGVSLAFYFSRSAKK